MWKYPPQSASAAHFGGHSNNQWWWTDALTSPIHYLSLINLTVASEYTNNEKSRFTSFGYCSIIASSIIPPHQHTPTQIYTHKPTHPQLHPSNRMYLHTPAQTHIHAHMHVHTLFWWWKSCHIDIFPVARATGPWNVFQMPRLFFLAWVGFELTTPVRQHRQHYTVRAPNHWAMEAALKESSSMYSM